MNSLASRLLAMTLLAPVCAMAHDAWLLPSATILSGDEAWITVDAAVGNDKFYFNHRALSLTGLDIQGPDGQPIKAENPYSGHLRSAFDVKLSDAGTYRIALLRKGVSAQWKEKGKPKRWFGAAADAATHIPAHADDLKIQERISRVETFATKGKPTAPATVHDGIGLMAEGHPNDLFAGEETGFTVTIDGKVAARIPVEIVAEGSRYRDALEPMALTTDDKGRFSIKWPTAGRYWVSIQSKDDKTTVPGAAARNLSYSATLEVLPQ
ncbi:DUF4198 domain-containing protein [Parapusillimonas sp. SGNA-6]|nr:DUF4198 domain-containing protein [Parapusillimonas sp. SGNA-6]